MKLTTPSITLALLMFSWPCGAADNLNCTPPPPFGDRGQIGPIANAWQNFNGGQTVTVCADKVVRSKTVDHATCWSTQIQAINDHEAYACPLNTSCGVGIFTNLIRSQSSKFPGFDAVCITYQNQT